MPNEPSTYICIWMWWTTMIIWNQFQLFIMYKLIFIGLRKPLTDIPAIPNGYIFVRMFNIFCLGIFWFYWNWYPFNRIGLQKSNYRLHFYTLLAERIIRFMIDMWDKTTYTWNAVANYRTATVTGTQNCRTQQKTKDAVWDWGLSLMFCPKWSKGAETEMGSEEQHSSAPLLVPWQRWSTGLWDLCVLTKCLSLSRSPSFGWLVGWLVG